MRIGLDLDNTIIDYDQAFAGVAAAQGWLPPDGTSLSKRQVRDAIRRQPDGERRWMALQGQVYGAHIGLATPFDGMAEAVFWLADQPGVELHIVSHKTRHGHFDESRIDLHEAARAWLLDRGLVGDRAPIPEQNLFFEETRQAKIARIVSLGLTAFVDDLEEVLVDPDFPAATARLWFAVDAQQEAASGLQRCNSWQDIGRWFREHLNER